MHNLVTENRDYEQPREFIDNNQNQIYMSNPSTNPLSEFQTMLLSAATMLVKFIDLYTILKKEVTGIDHNNVSAFRNDAYSVALAAAIEFVNDKDDTYDAQDAVKAESILKQLRVENN